MQQTNLINNSFMENSSVLDFSLSSWCKFVIDHGYCLNYDQIKNLGFVLDAEGSDGEEVILSDQDITRLVTEYYHKNVFGKERKRTAEIVMGLPGCGKSYYLRNKNCVICDSDLVKELMPEYEGGLGNERCHKASKIVFNELIKKLAYDGYKLGIPIIGKKLKSFNEIYDILVQNGYTVYIKYIKISKIEAMNNSLLRFIKDGRLVSFDYINEINENDIDDVYSKVINYPNVVKRNNDLVIRARNYKKLYAVKAKCGHVGVNYYIEKEFLDFASDGKEAASKTRLIGRVKHHHKDAIIDVRKIDFDEGRVLWLQNEMDPFLHCKNRREQDAIQFDLDICEEKKETFKKSVDKDRKIKINNYKDKRCRDEIKRYKQMEEYE